MDMVAERAASKHVELALLIEEGDIHVSLCFCPPRR
jgi:hypothetical protein